MLTKFLSLFVAGHTFFSHKEQQKFEMELETRREKILSHTLFSF